MFGKLLDYQVKNQEVIVKFEKRQAKIQIITDEIWNVFASFDSEEEQSAAIEGNKQLHTEFTVVKKENYIQIATNSVIANVYDDLKIDFCDSKGTIICEDYRGERKVQSGVSEEFIQMALQEGHQVEQKKAHYKIEVLKKMQGDEAFYGLGDKTGFLNKRGYEYEMWNTDNPDPQVDCFKALYKSIPFYIALRKENVYGLFYDNTYRSYFDMGKESEEYYLFGAEQGNLNYYYIAGDSMKDVIGNYTYLTGRTGVPQLWTLGYQQSRWGYESECQVRELAANLRKHDLPCDVIHLDIDYMERFKVFTWNKEHYDDPKKLIKELGEDGFKIVTIIDPGVKVEEGYPVYEEGIKNGYFATDKEGDIYVNSVWPGKSVFPDFGNEEARTWWGNNHAFLLEQGVRGIWNDMNEPASFEGPLPDDVVFSDGVRKADHAKVHNIYGHMMAKATYEGLKRIDGRRPYVITRACYAGSQKYATAWTGDNHSIWSHLKMAVPQLCNLGVSGMAFVGTDIGGFGSDATKELLCRWVQVGCFSPLFRNHSAKGTRFQEPWQFDEETIAINRKYIKLRYRLLPYFYDLFYQTEKEGLPVVRPLIMHYEQDEIVKNMNEEFLVGESVLVAPVLDQGQMCKMVYLPEGTWYDYWTKEMIEGGRYILRDAPLDVCPIYVKAGAILPNYTEQSYVGEKKQDTLILDIYPGEGSYTHYQDNGEDFAYQEGAYNEYQVKIDKDNNCTVRLVQEGYDANYTSICINCLDHVVEFQVNDMDKVSEGRVKIVKL
ncbi:glycoside hydrolase family 31 protein [Anaerosporobacter sp.]|uniref:glycoside hydrolase family 31 protein n=1 Tax=Anaerosporobacter sp. TaxID=1872529 RepID=UPI00286ECB8E|nr:glycoside hydrolase family 31 protein [Anaerosporobacter sp.]